MGCTYVLACRTPWALAAFARRRERLPGRWHVLTAKADLSPETLAALNPRYVFFPHWSWIVPAPLTKAYECVCFHMTDVPYGRGGSPLQNLIARGHSDTVLTALRMDEGTDTGPVYYRAPLSLEGAAESIYQRAADLSFDLMERIIAEEPEPVPQSGDPVLFARRRPQDSRLPAGLDAGGLYDHIRMLDAEGYPHAFGDLDDWRLTFTDARRDEDGVSARVRFAPIASKESK